MRIESRSAIYVAAVDSDVDLDAILEPNEFRRENLGELLGHIGMLGGRFGSGIISAVNSYAVSTVLRILRFTQNSAAGPSVEDSMRVGPNISRKVFIHA